MNTVYLMLPLYLNKHLMIIINSHESWLGNGQHDWNIAGCTFHTMIDTVTISGGSRRQLLVSSPSSFSPDSKNIDWLPFLNQHLHFWLTNIKFFQFLSQFLWKKNTQMIHHFLSEKRKSSYLLIIRHLLYILSYSISVYNFIWDFFLHKSFFLPSARSSGVSEFVQLCFFLLLLHCPSRDSLVLLKSFLLTNLSQT